MYRRRNINQYILISLIISIILGVITGLIFPNHFLFFDRTIIIELILGVITLIKVFPEYMAFYRTKQNCRSDLIQFLRYVFLSATGAVMSSILSLSVAFERTSALDRVIFGVDISFFFTLFFSIIILFFNLTHNYND